MAWRWWWRRRRRWPRRRRTTWRRRPRPRRRRRTTRTRRRGRVRRWRRRGRGWRRRTYVRRRRRRKKKINITQWNPATVRKCVVTGYIPLLICGTGTTGTTYKNYGSHMNDFTKFDPFGGGFSTLMFNLRILYDEYKKQRCRWSRSNDGLELVRYLGCSFTLYREQNVDFLFKYNRKQPFVDSQLTGPSLHPGIIMKNKRKVIISSYKTKPKGKPVKRVKIKPPTLFTDRWYFQKDFSKFPLVTVSASAADLRFPFCSPQTDNICIYFQILDPYWYNRRMSISADLLKSNYDSFFSLLNTKFSSEPLYPNAASTVPSGPIGTVFNTFKTQEHVVDPSYSQYKKQSTGTKWSNTYVDSLWGDHVYKNESNSSILQAMKDNATKMYERRKRETYLGSKYINHKTGLYSSIFLANERTSPDFPGLYQEVVYNPMLDEGEGNIVWIDWCTKDDTTFRDLPQRYAVKDLPLWAAFMGYRDYVTKALHDPGLSKEVRVTIICPYTQPKMFNPDSTDEGYVPYDYNFGKGKMPDGNGYIPISYRFNWYPCMFHQQNFMDDIVKSGPFAYHGTEKSCTLTAKYRFRFLFGGNPISQQVIKDPTKQPDFQIPGARDLFSTVQVTNPKLIDEGYFFNAWDIRRGLFGFSAIKRMQQQQIPTKYFTGPPKRPRFEVPAIANGGSDLLPTKWHPWNETSEEEEDQKEDSPSPQEKAPIQLVLQQQLREQRELKRRIQFLVKQLVKTQYHLHAPIIH
nr:MAG: ORF1 [Torque teno virus]